MASEQDKLVVFENLGFAPNGETGGQVYGDCPFCGKENKFYVSKETGQWDCKAGHCQRSGNVYTFLEGWFKIQESNYETAPWKKLAENRKIPIQALTAAGLAWDGTRWAIPVRNTKGTITTCRFYKPGRGKVPLMALTGLPVGLYGSEYLGDPEFDDQPVYVCEGEWDAIALREKLHQEEQPGITVAVPGAGTFKSAWLDPFKDRDVILCYDADVDGQKGAERAKKSLEGVAGRIYKLDWPEEVPEHFDIRDFVSMGGDVDDLWEMTSEVSNVDRPGPKKERVSKTDRPTFERVLEVFGQHLHMTEDFEIGVRLAFATVLSNQILGDPLWMFIVGPPGCGKTVILNALALVPETLARSTLTAHSLVSGFRMEGGKDPSLIPQLKDKIFVLKDFTEVLGLPKMNREEIYAILRGAYDGKVEKSFGNAVTRIFEVHFSMLAGVTHQIYGDRSASMGERFLMYHMVKGVGFDAGYAIRAALGNVGEEDVVTHELAAVTRDYLDWKVDGIPELPDEYFERLVGLSQLVAMLRGSVEKDMIRERLQYRPQHEVGTRLAKQLKKLMIALALLEPDRTINQRVYNIAARVALDTCVGFNLDVVKALARGEDLDVQALVETTGIPSTTLRDRLDDLELLGVLKKLKLPNPSGRGAPTYRWKLSDRLQLNWELAGLKEAKTGVARVKIRKKPR